MSNEQDVFSFDLNELLYFERGQEVSEMIGISLDPEISIQPFNEYVSIRGVIELHGEYRKVTESDSDMQSLDFDEQHSRRYFEKIKDTTNDRAEFSHRFPVEISVPSYRVANTDDITVSVESFDYEIPEENQLKLTSTIEIYGISNQAEYPKKVQDRLETEVFEFEIKEEASADQRGDVDVDKTEKVNLVDGEDPDDKDRWNQKKTQSFQEFFQDNSQEETAELVEDADIEVDIVEEVIESTEMEPEVEVASEPESEPDPEREPDTDLEQGVHYLADMFGNTASEGEEQYTQMRICIVQGKDTLETISERYQIPKLQLLKQNSLEDDNIIEGQLLSIPFKKEQ